MDTTPEQRRQIVEMDILNRGASKTPGNPNAPIELPTPEVLSDGTYKYLFANSGDVERYNAAQSRFGYFLLGVVFLVFGVSLLTKINSPAGVGSLGFLFGISALCFFAGWKTKPPRQHGPLETLKSRLTSKRIYYWRGSVRRTGRLSTIIFYVSLENDAREFELTREMYHAIETGQQVELSFIPGKNTVQQLIILSPTELKPKTLIEISSKEAVEVGPQNKRRFWGGLFVAAVFALVFLFYYLQSRGFFR